MIKYKLICKKCDLLFDSWFASSTEYEKLKDRNFLNCHKCGSKKVEKSLMAPQFINKYKKNETKKEVAKLRKINNKLLEYQKFIKNNFDYVGKNFAYEARSLHYHSKKKAKGIYGIASKDEINELKEEGINTETIPWLIDKNN